MKEAGLDPEIERFPFKEEDLRYYKVRKKPRKDSNALMILLWMFRIYG